MVIDLHKMLAKIKASQWALADIDWDAPGAEMIDERQKPLLKRFMADLVWIEHIGARGFAALALNARDDTLKEIYRYFHAEEQRHANAELALMRRWGMLEHGEVPQPNINLQITLRVLERYGDDMPLSMLGSVIPMLEIALDGALLKFLLDEVEDPLCHRVFDKINADEARHLGVDFHVLEMIGGGPQLRNAVESAGVLLRPVVLAGLGLGYLPLLSHMRESLVGMGLKAERLHEAMNKYGQIGDRNPGIGRNPIYQLVRAHANLVVRNQAPYRLLVGVLGRASRNVSPRWLGPEPAWVRQLTYDIAA
ncbi:MAG: hypothetical protein P4L83_20295 [Nevskia sp.]|nr:hypothetical protein [Nevskia sp.]